MFTPILCVLPFVNWSPSCGIRHPIFVPAGNAERKLAQGVPMQESSDLRMTRIPLSHGAGQMPALGFGTLIPDAALTLTATRVALDAGFRHFDCAERYGNEREVGEALQAGL